MTSFKQTVYDDNPARMPEGLGTSEAFLAFQERLSRAARVNRSVLLIGERGTGKELAASRLHYLSERWRRPLITLNCAALAPTLIAPELFGYEAGAFTGAEQRRLGRFEAAHQSTLFLDEIGNIPMEAQEKILRVIEYGTFERVGSTASITVDVRIIAATNAHLPALAAEGRFKPDLLDRLSFEVLFLPPLRERQGDIELLANHFAAQMAHELGRSHIPEFSDEAIDALEAYPWPGNIRELKNAVERAVYRADSEHVTEIVFDPFSDPFATRQAVAEPLGEVAPESAVSMAEDDSPQPITSFHETIRDFEVNVIRQALEETRYHQRKAAERLGLTYHQFRGLYRKYHARLARD